MRYRVLASYQGAQYEAGIGPDDAGVVLFAACPPPEELHFEPATGHWRKRVSRADVQMLYESRPIGMFRGERCVVLDDLGDRLHIVYLGHDAFRAEQLGYWEVDRGVFELITPRQEVTEILELRLPLPLPGDGGPHSGPIPAINPANGYGPGATTGPYHTGPIPAVRPSAAAGPMPPAGSIFPNTGPIPAVGPKAPGRQNAAAAANAGSRPNTGPGSKLPAGRSGVSMPPADEAPLPLEAEAMRAATRRGKKAQAPQAQPQRASQQSQRPQQQPQSQQPQPRQPQPRQQGPAQAPPAQSQPAQSQPAQPQPAQPQPARAPQPAQVGPAATAAARAQAPTAGPVQAPAVGPLQAPAATAAAPAAESLPADARTQATGPNHAPAQVPVSQSGQPASPGPADAAGPSSAPLQPAAAAAGLSEPANAAYLDPEAASGVPSWTPQSPPQHGPIEPQPAHGLPAQDQPSQAVPAAGPDPQPAMIPAGVAVVGEGSTLRQPEPTATVLATPVAVGAPPAPVLPEPPAASVLTPPAPSPSQSPAPALPDAAQPSASPAQPVTAEAPLAEAAPQSQPASPQQRQAAPVVGRRRRSTKRRLPTQRIFSDLATQAAIPASAYAIGEDVDGAMCLMRTDEGFEVFNSAAGARHEIRVFDDEESAYFYLFGVLVADAVRTGALAPRQ
jgi:hypothetical protein